jgi:rRNA pseudouridine-1189 N-methylase Emg1 (Nep1/Mra1 family)
MEAIFLFKNELVITELDKLELFQLEKSGLKSMIGKLRNKVWLGLKLRGERVTLSELKFKGLKKQE